MVHIYVRDAVVFLIERKMDKNLEEGWFEKLII